MNNGTFYALGVGPGDPELLTRKACRILSGCPVIAAPRTASGEMLALDIAKGAVDLTGKEILPLEFAMARQVSGRDVAMVNLGDVSIYATAYYVLDVVRSMGFRTEMVPGVPSFCAVAAALGRSLTEPEAPLHVYPAGKTDLDAALAQPGTKVLMKSGSAMAATAQALERQGLAGKSAMVADCGLPTEQVFQTMENLPEKISYFATVIVPEK